MMNKQELLYGLAATDFGCRSCGATNSLFEGARLEKKFTITLSGAEWNRIIKTLESTLEDMSNAAKISTAVTRALHYHDLKNKQLLAKIKEIVIDEDGYIKDSDGRCLKQIQNWAEEMISYSNESSIKEAFVDFDNIGDEGEDDELR